MTWVHIKQPIRLSNLKLATDLNKKGVYQMIRPPLTFRKSELNHNVHNSAFHNNNLFRCFTLQIFLHLLISKNSFFNFFCFQC